MNTRILYIFIIALLCCMCQEKTSVRTCDIYSSKDKDYTLISGSLENIMEDSLWQNEFKIQVRKYSYILTDLQNNWEKEFSSDYFDVIIKDFTKQYILIYCPNSGIKAGYKLFAKKKHDIYLISRKGGKIVKHIEITRGLANGIIINQAIFLKFIEPDEIRKCYFM